MAPAPRPRPHPRAAGIFVAIGAIAGAFIGGAGGQATLGFLIGTGTGAATALGFWLIDRRG